MPGANCAWGSECLGAVCAWGSVPLGAVCAWGMTGLGPMGGGMVISHMGGGMSGQDRTKLVMATHRQ